jgi:transcription antitermination factor NusG
MDAKWYAVYTKPRWEKKVAEELTFQEFTNYCPLHRVTRQWSDRKKTIEEPLFTSYVFVKVTEKQLGELRKVSGILNLVHWLGRPAVIPEPEIHAIRQFLSEHSNVKLEKTALQVNDTIKVTQGTFQEKEGTVVAIKNHTVKVALPSLGFTLYVETDLASIEKITEKC